MFCIRGAAMWPRPPHMVAIDPVEPPECEAAASHTQCRQNDYTRLAVAGCNKGPTANGSIVCRVTDGPSALCLPTSSEHQLGAHLDSSQDDSRRHRQRHPPGGLRNPPDGFVGPAPSKRKRAAGFALRFFFFGLTTQCREGRQGPSLIVLGSWEGSVSAREHRDRATASFDRDLQQTPAPNGRRVARL